ncbi:hypothetical protein [Chlamydia vaughanii]|uniref:hypothetical protein n=1 Tax=Chlamydia vaughanii TaxID=3112552 RepID=UPI0032B2726C
MPCIENIKDVFGGLGSCNLSVEKIPAFREERKCVDISRVVITILGAIFAVSILVLGIITLNISQIPAALAGGCTIILGMVLLAWVVIMILRLCGIGKIAKEPFVGKVPSDSDENLNAQSPAADVNNDEINN